VFAQHLLAIRLALYELHGFKAADNALGGVTESPDTREQIKQPEGH
jgi:hypothetical protein